MSTNENTTNPYSHYAFYGIPKEDVDYYVEATADFIPREGEPQILRLSSDPKDTRTITIHGRVQYTDSSFTVIEPSVDEARTLARISMKRAAAKGMSGIDLWVGNVLPCKALQE